jgi:ElaB/YqjD/DUF883 family membrane-anchored ribosome-binding protein
MWLNSDLTAALDLKRFRCDCRDRRDERRRSGQLNARHHSSNLMEKTTESITNEMAQIAEHARELVSATADVAGGKVTEARKRLMAALENSKEIYGCVREKAVKGAKAADDVIREHPYQAIGVALGVGAVLGFLISRRTGCQRD